MAIHVNVDGARTVGLEEFIEFVSREVDLRDTASILSAAPLLRGLANDRELVVRRLNEQVKTLFKRQAMASAQSIFLGSGEGFYVRANLWPSTADISGGRVYQDQFSYHLAHDHNYDFLTVGYFGPGYLTDIYEYDYDRLEGYPGEPVELTFLERTHFGTGMVMFYRRSKDLHLQYPPDDLSITLNLMVSTPEVRLRDQYFFDLDKRVLLDYPAEMDASRRISVLRMVGFAGDDDTRQLLSDLAQRHPCRRTRLAAVEALVQLEPARAEEIWQRACRDRAPLVANTARRRLAALEGAAAGALRAC